MTTHKSEDYKLSAVQYYLVEDVSQVGTCKIFNCSPRSLMRWVEQYESQNNIKRHNRKPIAYKVHKEHVKYLLDEIKKNKTITMNDLLVKLKKKFKDLSLSRYHVSRIMNDNNITLKITHVRHEPTKRFGKDINISEQLKNYYAKIKKYNLDDIICIDETSINALQVRHHCYNELGKRCTIKTQSQDVFKKYTAIFAISTKGVIGWKLYDKGGIDSNRLKEFLEENITTKYKNKLIILDNASSHRNATIKEIVNKNNELLHSVPYQHYTNAIEQFFSVLKSHLQKMKGNKFTELNDNIRKALRLITKTIYANIFRGTYDRKECQPKQISNRWKTPKNYL